MWPQKTSGVDSSTLSLSLFLSSVMLSLSVSVSLFHLCFLILWLGEWWGEATNDTRDSHPSVGWCIIDPWRPSGWKVKGVESHGPYTHTGTTTHKDASTYVCPCTSLHTNTLARFVCLLFNYFAVRVTHSDACSSLQSLYIILLNKALFQSVLNQTTSDTSVSRCSDKPHNNKKKKTSSWELLRLQNEADDGSERRTVLWCYQMAVQDDKTRPECWGQIRQ